MQLGPAITVLTILLYVCLNANKLYLNMLSEALLGNILGATGKTLLRSLFQGIAMLAEMVMAIICGLLISVSAGFVAMILMTLAITLGVVIGASTAFDKMESYS